MCSIGAQTPSLNDPTERFDRWGRVGGLGWCSSAAWIASALTLSGCGDPDSSIPKVGLRTLVDHRQWSAIDGADDPLAGHQPPTIDCGIAGWYVELGTLEIDTGRCNYPLIEHPALLHVPAGNEITTQLRYYDLLAAEPAEAHVAILIGDQVQWETMIAIPQTANVLDLSWRTPNAIKVGDPIRFHLHNHGQNHWGLDAIMAEVPIDP